MKKLFIQVFDSIGILIKFSIRIIFLLCFLCLIMAGVDFLQVRNGDFPTFTYASHMKKRNIQEFTGVFHRVYRTIHASPRESFKDSSQIEFQLITYRLPLVVNEIKEEEKPSLTTVEAETCKVSKLYYADLDVKVYTYCLDEIKYQNKDLKESLEKDNIVIEDIISHLDYKGFMSDKTTLEFQSKNDSYTNQGLRIYRCHKTNIPDIYIGPEDMTFQMDFCEYKNDDFKFIYQLTDETPESLQPLKNAKGEEIPEVFYDDGVNRYEFDLPKSNYVFITTPEVRGKMATKTTLKAALTEKLVTIEELKEKGLKFQTINKAEEAKRLEEERKKKEEEERKKKEEEAKKQQQEAQNNPS